MSFTINDPKGATPYATTIPYDISWGAGGMGEMTMTIAPATGESITIEFDASQFTSSPATGTIDPTTTTQDAKITSMSAVIPPYDQYTVSVRFQDDPLTSQGSKIMDGLMVVTTSPGSYSAPSAPVTVDYQHTDLTVTFIGTYTPDADSVSTVQLISAHEKTAAYWDYDPSGFTDAKELNEVINLTTPDRGGIFAAGEYTLSYVYVVGGIPVTATCDHKITYDILMPTVSEPKDGSQYEVDAVMPLAYEMNNTYTYDRVDFVWSPTGQGTDIRWEFDPATMTQTAVVALNDPALETTTLVFKGGTTPAAVPKGEYGCFLDFTISGETESVKTAPATVTVGSSDSGGGGDSFPGWAIGVTIAGGVILVAIVIWLAVAKPWQ